MKGKVASSSGLSHQASFKAGNKTTVLKVDVSGVHDEVFKRQQEQAEKLQIAACKKAEMFRIHQQMKERELKANELRRKHQVRQNFKAAVRRAVIQYKFITQLEEKTLETRKAYGFKASKVRLDGRLERRKAGTKEGWNEGRLERKKAGAKWLQHTAYHYN